MEGLFECRLICVSACQILGEGWESIRLRVEADTFAADYACIASRVLECDKIARNCLTFACWLGFSNMYICHIIEVV